MKKVVYGAVLVLLVSFIFWIYSGFNGNPIKKVQAEKDMKSYLQKNYPDKDFQLGPVTYSMKFGSYDAVVTSKGDSNISFTLSWRKKAKVMYDEYIEKYAKDETLSKKFANEITERLKIILKDKLKDFNDAGSEIYIKKGAYSSTESYRKDMPEKVDLWVEMKGDKIPEEEFVERCVIARDEIAKEGYKIEGYYFSYMVNFEGDAKGGGEQLYSISLREKLLNASKEEILKSKKLYTNTGKVRMIAADMLYKGTILLMIVGSIGAGVYIAKKDKKRGPKKM